MKSGQHLRLPKSERRGMEDDLRRQARLEGLKIDIIVKDYGDNTVDISWTASVATVPATSTTRAGGTGRGEGERVTAGAPPAMAEKIAYQFGKSQLTLEFGDIVTSDAQVIVSSDDCYLSMGGGVSAAIRRAGGDDIVLDAAKKIPAPLAGVVVQLPVSFPLTTSFT